MVLKNGLYIPDNRTKVVIKMQIKIIYSSTISLFQEILNWLAKNYKTGGE
jgi:hypothetical protein